MNKVTKKHIAKGAFFILGIIVTLSISKIWDKTFPASPILVKEVTDSITIVHEHKIPKLSDSVEYAIESKIKNLKLLNDYENEIDKRIKRINNKENHTFTPNLISLDYAKKYDSKGYTIKSASPYFSLNFSGINEKYLDFKPLFFNKDFLADVAYLRLNIYRYKNINDKESKYYVMNEFYEVKTTNDNFIRIENDLAKGKYEIAVGFTLKEDLESKYPSLYRKRIIEIKD